MHTYSLPYNLKLFANLRRKGIWKYLRTAFILTPPALCAAALVLLMYAVYSTGNSPSSITVHNTPPASATIEVDGRPAALTYTHTSTGEVVLLHEQQWTCVLQTPSAGKESALESQIRDLRQRGYGPSCIPGG